MHGLIAYGRLSQIVAKGEFHNAADYLCNNGIGNEMQLLYVENGKLRTRIGPGVQGHPGQLLAILAQSNVSADHPMTIDGKQFTVRDLIEFEKRDCRSNTELTFKLIGLANYLDPAESWTNDRGETWNFPRLIREELKQPIHNGACGGTHRLMGFSFAVYQMEKRGQPLAGEWTQAARMIDGYAQRAFKLQNARFGRDAAVVYDWAHTRMAGVFVARRADDGFANYPGGRLSDRVDVDCAGV
jgi:hypothetical protein